MIVLQPTGKCFDDAIEFIEESVTRDPDLAFNGGLWLVHAIARIPEGQEQAGDLFAHAWCEQRVEFGGLPRGVVWHSALAPAGHRIYLPEPRARYYRRLRVVNWTSYSIQEIWVENQRHGTHGPWLPEYLALTKQGKKGA